MLILYPYHKHIIQTSAVQDIVETPHIPIGTFINLLLLTPTTNPGMSAPYLVQNAAASLNAALQAGLGRESQVTPGLTIEDLRAIPAVASQAPNVLSRATLDVPPLNPLEGIGQQRPAMQQVLIPIFGQDIVFVEVELACYTGSPCCCTFYHW